ncbi:radical SAM/SPASM domain-containing protein [Breznakiella homolactica]|uniref:SPASM domain-containing protein n=1 Tax=Breznakiella homolactica TaxID=2798577 RepID=A0A7T7XLJ1_9SPIR|nr:SPASM domain-containing protein [Breznakiella homolactica]QQO08502.1 SPASM domain-containing protein [Breznakiella homolactica]
METIGFLIKPASGRCNLACRYCFYRDVAENRERDDYGIMDLETARKLISRALEPKPRLISFGFQGGEPTLAGLAFFESFAEMAREQIRQASAEDPDYTAEIQFTLQTNGVSLTPAWADFFKRENFLIGISIDGPRLLHDTYRVRRDDSGTYTQVLDGARLLFAQGVPVNALCVVDALTADNAATVYRHLRSRGFDWIQFIPCLDPLGEEPGGRSWSLSPAAYGRFLREIFDLRYAEWRAGTPMNVRWIDNIVSMAMGFPPESCGMSGVCPISFTVEADGSVYPCDFYVTDEWYLGNIKDVSFEEMLESSAARRFTRDSRHKSPECETCFAYPLCRGGCRRDREPFKDGKPVLNRYCRSYKEFFSYAWERIREMADFESRNRSQT